MKIFQTIIYVLVVLLCVTGYALADEPIQVDKTYFASLEQSPDNPVSSIEADQSSSESDQCTESDVFELARRGCCSHHGGVCGCDESTDRIVCCDGTLSPSCRCSTY